MHSGGGYLDVVIEVVTALLPLITFFLVFQIFYLKFPWFRLKKILVGLAITGLGMVLFLSGVFMGFMPISTDIGMYLMTNTDPWLIVGFGFILGFLVTFAEPAVRVLTYQVEHHSSGFIHSKVLLWTLSFGVGSLVSLGMAKIVFDLDFHTIIIIGYSLALILMIFCDRDFVSVAFDAGAVATGPMAVSLLMAMVAGIAKVKPGADPVVEGFGIIALIALAPIIFISALGIIIRFKNEKKVKT